MYEDYKQGYYDAIDDVQEAMKLAEVNTLGPAGFLSYNDPKLFVEKLKELRVRREKLLTGGI